MKINSSEQHSLWHNSSTWPPLRSSAVAMSCFTMTFGAISNLTALGILTKARVRFRRRSKAPFLLLTLALLAADLGGHVIPGAFALYLHMGQRRAQRLTTLCQVFGASMVFFGLCPLLFGGAMAVERCVAITHPFFHAAAVTESHVRRVVLFLSSLALVLAVLPLFAVGTYTLQFPGTWCFLPIHAPRSAADTSVTLAFSCLGLAALTLSLLCNIVSVAALLQPRIRPGRADAQPSAHCARRPSSASASSSLCSLDVEMMAQLAALTVVSCVCWSPFLIHVFLMQINPSSRSSSDDRLGLTLLSLRMASWNQILDPWVYILLRRAVLLRVSCFLAQKPVENSSYADRGIEMLILK